MRAAFFSAVALAWLVGGCMTSPTEQGHVLEFNGLDPGDQEAKVPCDGFAWLRAHVEVDRGEVVVHVLDAGDRERYQNTFRGSGIEVEKKLEGTAGEWTILVERTRVFEGSYRVWLDCEPPQSVEHRERRL